eukprot:TRINITY_DN5227_c0_g1_i1.p1 TRINITY_DN5227_c0_g1~~TRINITY_DN5227_c0_g1_i1.p1  ORF type:complete len:527 (-),score=218.82 TRINITY_DN5227_c0_g1_i1:95-1675(-)
MIVPKSVTPKPKKSPKAAPFKESLIIKDLSEETTISKAHVSSIVKAAVKLGQRKKSGSKLFEGDGKGIHVQVTGIKVPKESRSHLVKCTLPHKINKGSLGVALFVKDLTKNFKDDHEPTIQHFDEVIRSSDFSDRIDEIIPLRGLKSEYQTFELKRRLSNKYDKFLADTRIMHRLPKVLGKHFYSKKKIPIPVNMEAEDLSKELSRALHTVILPLRNKGVSSDLILGSTSMNLDSVVENILHFLKVLKSKYPGGWKNIRSIYVKTDSSTSLPLHISTTSIKDLGFVDAQKPKKKVRQPAVDELSTLPGAKVKVLADGTVKVRRVMDSNWDLDHEEPFVSGSEAEEEEDKEEEGSKKKKEEKKKKDKKADGSKKRRREVEAEEIPSKKFKNPGEDSDSEDEQMYQNELNFMKKMALEEEEMERRNREAPADDVDESKVVEETVNEEGSESDDDEESVVDDLCIKGESLGSGQAKTRLDKPSRKERTKVKGRKKMAKDSGKMKKSPGNKKPMGKKMGSAAKAGKKSKK